MFKNISLNGISEEQIDLILEQFLPGIFLYAALGFILLAATALIVIKLKAPEKFSQAVTVCVGVAVGFAFCVILTVISLTIARYTLKGRINTYFWMGVGMLIGIVALIFAGAIISVAYKKALKIYSIVSICLVIAYSILMVILLPEKESDYAPSNGLVYYLLSAVIVLVLALAAFLNKTKSTQTTKSITYAAACISVGFALSYIKFWQMPQGGSITLASMLPLMLYSYMFGTKKGLIAGFIYGLLQFMQSPMIYEPMQFLLDYPLAFSGIGIAGVARGMKIFNGNKIAEFCVGSILAAIVRYVCHVVSGVFVFYTWAYDATPLVYSLVYNSYVFVDLLITVVIGIIILCNKSFVKQINNVSELG